MSQDTEPKRPVDPETSAVSAEPQVKTVSLKLSTLLISGAAVLLIGALVWVAVLWQSARGALNDRDAQAANDKHAEQIASDYAIGAANLNYADFNAWTARLKSNTTPALANKFDATSSKLQQILVPLKWTSSPTLLSSQVINRDNGVYKVNVYLNVNSTNAQNPDGVLTTVYYTVNVDPKEWKVTDVGGIDLPLPRQ
ncbi:hypothetical protein [Nocardia seriolae]|uniref:Mce-associated membrane protein n=1 Tax=Nocardia seriolae TaxID=37332 RepID=A0A0B8NCN7_9NOCA|nr:hypothetical protein [Nocardia seriolae]APB01150.1 hypothetical protein NS506_07125 [Nocardia seriolae]MTJ61346.1 hypothetical protein [Nocardia seriolae]MTJ71758.1 hypothetical protein [Nocardia seriolae]MTJ90530.1 hypothetical protein [Nocardia seriolae]MTK34490.1 hypothetical protein [Nocardia seriolae]